MIENLSRINLMYIHAKGSKNINKSHLREKYFSFLVDLKYAMIIDDIYKHLEIVCIGCSTKIYERGEIICFIH